MFNKQSKFTRTASLIIIGLGVLLFVAFFASLAHSATTTGRRNSFGAVIAHDNPFIYMFGTVRDITTFKCGKDWECTNVKFQPYHRSLLDTEEVLFCGDQTDLFIEDGKLPQGPIIVTYARQASHNAGGVGCHMAESAYELPSLEAQ